VIPGNTYHRTAIAVIITALLAAASVSARQEPATAPPPRLADRPGAAAVLPAPVIVEGPALDGLAPAAPEAGDTPLPINLATALRLSGARPVVLAAAQASVQLASAELQRARVLWLPSFDVGAGYYRHDGITQGQSGNIYINSKDNFFAGGGLTAKVDTADALFAPLAARQVLRARVMDVQTARNDALLATAEAYFNVQQARGNLASAMDVVAKSLELGKKINAQRIGASKPTDLHRARALLADFEESVSSAREQWTLASADLTRELRLDPGAIVVPLEPPHLRVTLISPDVPVDTLIPIGLTNRPELASQQALVQAALARIRQERMRPLMPSLILQGNPGPSGPGGYFMAGVFGSGANGVGNPWMARDDVSAGLVWELQNLGLGNRALVRERRAEQQQLLVELFRIQDTVAAEIARARGQLRSATERVTTSERGLEEARLAYSGSLDELGKIDVNGDVGVVVRRAFEVIDALRALSRAYDAYFQSANDYNRAQFRLYRALGYPAQIVECEHPTGPIMPVDVTRPPQMAPVCDPPVR
jgi:outer membrane protein TolC